MMKKEDKINEEGFAVLNPEPLYFNPEGSDPLMGVFLKQGEFQKFGHDAQQYYEVLVMRQFMNGPSIDVETGEMKKEPRQVLAGEIIRVGARAQIVQYCSHLVGRSAVILIKPVGKVRTARGNTCWQFQLLARALTPEESAFVEQHTLSGFVSL